MSRGEARTRSGGAQKFTFRVSADDAGLRLDQVLARRVPELSRRKARLVIELGGVFVERSRVKVQGRSMRVGQRVEVTMGGALERASATTGERARKKDEERLPAYSIAYEDDDLVVVDKPSGLLSAPTPESDRNNLADLLGRRSAVPERVWVVHRLDLETSGLLVLAKTPLANRGLAELFRRHDVEREYRAVVRGNLAKSPGRIDAPIEGRSAVSHIDVERALADVTLVRVRLETGRTHQVRIHLRGLGHPVCADRRYGESAPGDPPRLALHATRLGFVHPGHGKRVAFESPWPQEMRAWVADLASASGPESPIC